jgi:ATP-binding cassette, subfamily C, bacterial LapB
MTTPTSPAALQDKVAAAFAAAPQSPAVPADPLMLALADMARRMGQSIQPEGLAAGLPLTRGRLALAHLPQAAERAGLSAEILSLAAGDIAAHDCPLALPMKNGSVLIATGVEGQGADRHVVVEVPGGAHPPRAVPVDGLARVATGDAIRFRPLPARDHAPPLPGETTAGRWFAEAFAKSTGTYGNVVLATIMLNLLALALPLFTMNVYDRVIPNAALSTLTALSIGAVLAIIFDFVMRGLRADLVDIAGRAADVRLSNGLFARLLGARHNPSPGSVGVQANTLREFETLGDFPFAIAFFVAIAVIAGPLVAAPIVVGLSVLVLSLVVQRRLARLMADQFRDMAQKNAVAVETLVGLETLKSIGAESWAAERWERATADGLRVSTEIRRLTNLASHIVVAGQSLVTVLMVLHGTYLVLAGQITTGALIAAVMLAGRALAPVGQMAMLVTRAFQARQAYTALKTILEAPQEREAGRAFVGVGDISGALALDGVSFAYGEEGEAALRNVSMTVRAGERIAILGAIGSGKSTLLRLFPALLLPKDGKALVDGVAVQHIDPAVLRRAVAFVPQDAMLFRGTLRQNILIHAPMAADKDLIEAVGITGAAEWINRLPKGLDTIIGERGQGLSGGQRQAIALARALVTRPKVLLLDEPTGAMDGRTETGLLKRIAAYAARTRATLVIVTHRPAVLDIVDRIMVLDRGVKLHDGAKAAVLAALAPRPASANQASNNQVSNNQASNNQASNTAASNNSAPAQNAASSPVVAAATGGAA